MSTPTLETLQKQLTEALNRITDLERDLERMRQNTNTALRGNAYMLETLVAHTGCKAPTGQYFSFGTNFDVGHH
jgi:predicted RNase H-like nuclease (RuvC/YqgF family)